MPEIGHNNRDILRIRQQIEQAANFLRELVPLNPRPPPPAAVGAVAMLMYPMSLGPACWVTSRIGYGAALVPRVYGPVTRALSGPPPVYDAIQRYSHLGAAPGWWWRSTYHDDGRGLYWEWRGGHAF